VFVALKGANFDGHDFVANAAKGGAAGAVVEESWTPSSRPALPLLRVADTTDALMAMASGYRRKVGLRVIAVTGSAGKSTVKEMTGQILGVSMPVAMTRGNWNNNIGLSLSLLAMDPANRVGVFEVGTNHPGEIEALCRVLRPDWGVVTNIGPAHIEHFGSLKAIAEEKGGLLRSLPPEGLAVLNGDDGAHATLREACRCRVVTVSFASEGDYRGEWVDGSTREAILRETASGETFRINNRVPGRHNLLNAAMAVAVARQQGQDWKDIAAGLASYQPLHMRWEERVVRGVRVVNDAYNANPLSMRAALATFAAESASGEKWLALGGMLELGQAQTAEHEALGREVAARGWAGVLAVGELGRMILRGAEDAGMARHRLIWCSDNREASSFLRQRLQPGDAVLLKASRGARFEEIVEQFEMTGGR
jgi:UDP-N-acetylmuramoyl-tripeptide--D-alanyl-D-alanine ligase